MESEAQSEVIDLHEQLMEEVATDDPIFNDDCRRQHSS